MKYSVIVKTKHFKITYVKYASMTYAGARCAASALPPISASSMSPTPDAAAAAAAPYVGPRAPGKKCNHCIITLH